MSIPEKIEFNRPAKYQRIDVLGSGACGETVRIRDEGMDAEFVAKKYCPVISKDDEPDLFHELLNRFRDEARILFRLNHPNIVRVFNYFDYSEYHTSYIIMEYISGSEILDHLRLHPANADRVFEGVVAGFAHLQSRNVLHRDIRPANIMIDDTGVPKIIDFGFGKHIGNGGDTMEGKSISLNWWCETPPEFSEGTYDFQTEVYFVGKLFQQAVESCNLDYFKYRLLLGSMCEPDRANRVESFSVVQGKIARGKFAELSFSNEEISTYRKFADQLTSLVSSVEADARFERDGDVIVTKLEELHRKSMLEETLPAPNNLAKILIVGGFRYWKNTDVYVEVVQKFVELLRGLSEEKRGVVVENLIMRLEAVERTAAKVYSDIDDEIPF